MSLPNLANKINILCGKIKSLSNLQNPVYISLNILDNIPAQTFTISQYIMSETIPIPNRSVILPTDIPFNTAFSFENIVYQQNIGVSGTDIIIEQSGDYVLLYSQIYLTNAMFRNTGNIVIVVNGEIRYLARNILGGDPITLNFALSLSAGDIVNIYNTAFLEPGDEINMTFRPYDFINVTLIRIS